MAFASFQDEDFLLSLKAEQTAVNKASPDAKPSLRPTLASSHKQADNLKLLWKEEHSKIFEARRPTIPAQCTAPVITAIILGAKLQLCLCGCKLPLTTTQASVADQSWWMYAFREEYALATAAFIIASAT